MLSVEQTAASEAATWRGPWWARVVSSLPRIAVGAALVLSAVPKVVQPEEFFQRIMAYRLVGAGVAKAVAMYLPYLEGVLGVLLVGGVGVAAAASASALLLAFFVGVQAVTLWRGLHVECGCFSVSGGGDLGWTTVVRTGVLLVLAIGAFCISRGGRAVVLRGGDREPGAV
jgi:hypothetical protein